jgi:hypothetical protein
MILNHGLFLCYTSACVEIIYVVYRTDQLYVSRFKILAAFVIFG